MLRDFENKSPSIGADCYIDESAVIIGDVVIAERCSVWPLVVIRGDVNCIHIGKASNIQDGSVLHVSHKGEFNPDGASLHIGEQVTIGHKVLLHGCKIGNRCLIGMGSIVMDNVVIEDEVMLGAGSVVTPGKTLESGYLYLGNPARQKRPLSAREIEFLHYSADHYALLIDRY